MLREFVLDILIGLAVGSIVAVVWDLFDRS